MGSYTSLDEEKIVETARQLKARIAERFPQSGLARVIDRLNTVSEHSSVRAKEIGRPIWALRGAAVVAVALMIAAIVTLLSSMDLRVTLSSIKETILLGEAILNDLILLGAAMFFLFTLETRYKRHRALSALHELRSIAHVIDMHQLTKDPERILSGVVATPSTPDPKLSPEQLGRYLDFCSESLALLSKIAALYAQHFDDEVALSAVDQIEILTNGLSRKIWQKMMILHQRHS
jgi:hypothetical protein